MWVISSAAASKQFQMIQIILKHLNKQFPLIPDRITVVTQYTDLQVTDTTLLFHILNFKLSRGGLRTIQSNSTLLLNTLLSEVYSKAGEMCQFGQILNIFLLLHWSFLHFWLVSSWAELSHGLSLCIYRKSLHAVNVKQSTPSSWLDSERPRCSHAASPFISRLSWTDCGSVGHIRHTLYITGTLQSALLNMIFPPHRQLLL